MYIKHFGFSDYPFTIGPNPKFLYLSEQHREAIAHLLYGLSDQGGFILLTGEVGTGKTTLCRSILQELPDNVEVALILNPRANSVELLQYICDELNIAYENSNSVKLLNDALNDYLLKAYSDSKRVVVIVDEAQQLSIETLEQVRLLTNLETNQDKLLQIILIGQPELNEILASNELRQLSQRIKSRYHLGELSPQQIKIYINNRLSKVGCEQQLFTDDSFRYIYKYTKGVPRLINILCDRCLMGAYAKDKHVIDKEIVIKAAKEIQGTNRKKLKYNIFKWFNFSIGCLLISLSTHVGETLNVGIQHSFLAKIETKGIAQTQLITSSINYQTDIHILKEVNGSQG